MTRPPPADPYLVPRYGVASLAELLPSVAASIGVSGEQNLLALPPVRRACVLLVDGLGWELLETYGAAAPFLASLLPSGRTLTAGFPATTSTNLTCFGTGLAAGQHGMLGYEIAVPGTGRLLNTLRWSERSDRRTGTEPPPSALVPEEWQPEPTLFQRAVRSGVSVTQVAPEEFRTGPLTRAALRGASYVGADSVEGRVDAAVAATRAAAPSMVYVYFGGVDKAGHDAGCGSKPWLAELAVADRLAQAIAERLPPDAALYVTADHGMVNVPWPARIDADRTLELRDGVALLGGDARARYVYALSGAAADVLATWREVLADRAWVLSATEAIEAGWFGQVADWVRPRMPDVLAACHGANAVIASTAEPRESALHGMHGSLTRAELVVPLLAHPPA